MFDFQLFTPPSDLIFISDPHRGLGFQLYISKEISYWLHGCNRVPISSAICTRKMADFLTILCGRCITATSTGELCMALASWLGPMELPMMGHRLRVRYLLGGSLGGSGLRRLGGVSNTSIILSTDFERSALDCIDAECNNWNVMKGSYSIARRALRNTDYSLKFWILLF